MSPCLSRNGEMPFRGMWQVTKRVILKSWSFFQNCHSLPENILYAERLQHKCSCYRGHAHIAVGIFVHRIHTCRSEKDLILAEMNLVYAMLDWQFSRCFWKTFPALKIILSSCIIYPSASLSFRDKYFQMFKHNAWDRSNVCGVVGQQWCMVFHPERLKVISKLQTNCQNFQMPLEQSLGTKTVGCQMHAKPLPALVHWHCRKP